MAPLEAPSTFTSDILYPEFGEKVNFWLAPETKDTVPGLIVPPVPAVAVIL